MEQYINKSALVAEIERRIEINDTCQKISGGNEFYRGAIDEAKEILSFLNTIEVKEVNEALRTEYEKGRADVIAKTLQWIHDLNQEHEIMSYTDSHVLSSEELQQYYKNIIGQ